jgi:hypothetical protein
MLRALHILMANRSDRSSSFPGMKAGMARRGVLAGIVAFAAMTAPAHATIRQGTASDPTGDATGGAGYDITSVYA